MKWLALVGFMAVTMCMQKAEAQYVVMQPVQVRPAYYVTPVTYGNVVYSLPVAPAYNTYGGANSQIILTPNSVHLRSQANTVQCDGQGCLYNRAYYNEDHVFSKDGYDKNVNKGASSDYVKHQVIQVPVQPVYVVPAQQYYVQPQVRYVRVR